MNIDPETKAEMGQQLLPKIYTMVESDLMKATHYMKKGVEVAIVAQDDSTAEDLAGFHVELNDLLERYQKRFTRKIVD